MRWAGSVRFRQFGGVQPDKDSVRTTYRTFPEGSGSHHRTCEPDGRCALDHLRGAEQAGRGEAGCRFKRAPSQDRRQPGVSLGLPPCSRGHRRDGVDDGVRPGTSHQAIPYSIGLFGRPRLSPSTARRRLRAVKIRPRGPGHGYPQRGFAFLEVH